MSLIRSVLVPVDFSEGARAALRYALELAPPFGAKITVLNVWEPPELASADLLVLARGEGEPIAEWGRRQARRELDEFVDGQGVSGAVARRIEIGRPRERILELAESGDYDLVVMGTHGRMGRARMLAGSVAEGVVRRSPIPVVTVRVAESRS
jgi:nucleotide-binding universal stress UspA family protein